MTTPIEDIQAAIAALRRDVDALKAESADGALERQQVRDALRGLRTSNTDPKPTYGKNVTMDDLTAKIRAAIDEDERLAKSAAKYGPTWTYSESGVYPSDESNHPGPIISGTYGDLEDEYGKHVVRHDPKRVLRQVAAYRTILDLHDRPETHGDFVYCRTCGSGEPLEYPTAWPCETLLAVADIYGIEHP